MRINTEKVRRLELAAQDTLSLDGPLDEIGDGDALFSELIEDETVMSPEESANHALLAKAVDELLLSSVSPREARVLRLRFGLQDGHAYTLQETCQKLGLTRERIRQIERDALHLLRNSDRRHGLESYRS